jgi:hypothetical protein
VSTPEVDALAKEYADWCEAHGYGNYHPREFLLYYASMLTDEQLAWFRAWGERWVNVTGSRI